MRNYIWKFSYIAKLVEHMNQKKKNGKDSDDLIDIVIQLNLTNVYRTSHSNQ